MSAIYLVNCSIQWTGFTRFLESPGIFGKISRTWKVLENELGLGKSWN